jgi:RNA polymerase sigma-70 factor (ECF subfamily)
MPDEALLPAIAGGKQAAFDELYLRYSDRLYRFFMRMLNNNAMQAEDLTQETFIKVFQAAARFDPERNFNAWCFHIAHNLLKNHWRKQSKLAYDELDELDDIASGNNIPQALDYQKFQENLDEVLLQLKEGHRACFILRYQEGLSMKEISEVCQVPEGTVRSRIHYSLKYLSTQLRHFEVLNTTAP